MKSKAGPVLSTATAHLRYSDAISKRNKKTIDASKAYNHTKTYTSIIKGTHFLYVWHSNTWVMRMPAMDER